MLTLQLIFAFRQSCLYKVFYKYAEQAQSFSPPEMKKAAGIKPAAP